MTNFINEMKVNDIQERWEGTLVEFTNIIRKNIINKDTFIYEGKIIVHPHNYRGQEYSGFNGKAIFLASNKEELKIAIKTFM